MYRLSSILFFAFGIFSPLSAQELTLFYGNTRTEQPNPFGSGFITGPNNFGDLAKYQRFDFSSAAKVKGATFEFSFLQINAFPDDLTVVARKVQPDGKPGDIIQSKPITADQLKADTFGVRFDFPFPVNVAANSGVFIGLEWTAAADDEFGLWGDADGEGDGANRAWEQISDHSFQALNDQGSLAWAVDIDLFIKAHYTLVSHVVDLDNDRFSFEANSPNPFGNATVFTVNLKQKAQQASLSLYDPTGRLLKTLVNEAHEAGLWQIPYVNELPKGNYFAKLNIDGQCAVRSISIQ